MKRLFILLSLLLSSQCFAMTIDSPNFIDKATGPVLNLTSSLEWTGGRVIYVPLSGDIATYITNASAGDTLVLAAGTYTITSSITVNKKLHIMGQGEGITTITCSTDGLVAMIDMASAGSRLSNMTISQSGALTGTPIMVRHSAACDIANVQFLSTLTGNVEARVIYGNSASIMNIENCTSSVTGACYTQPFVRCSTGGSTINIRNSNLYGSGQTRAADACRVIRNDSGTVNIYSSSISNTSASTSGVVFNAGGAINITSTTINGSGTGAFDVLNSSGVLTLYDTTLVNNTTSGTITYGGTVRSANFNSSNTSTSAVVSVNATGGAYYLPYSKGSSGQVVTIQTDGTTIWGAGGGGGSVSQAYSTIEDEGVALTQRSTMNFTGAGVSAADSGGKTVITINNNGYATGTGVASGSITAVFSGSPIATSSVAWVKMPYEATITEWDITAYSTAPTVICDVGKGTYTSFGPTTFGSIAGSEKPTLTSQQKNSDKALTTWTTSVSQNDYIYFNVTNIDTATECVVTVLFNRDLSTIGNMVLDSNPSSGTANGIMTTGLAGDTLAYGEALYLESGAIYRKASASTSSSVPVVAVALESIASGSIGSILLQGFISNSSWSFATGGIVWVSPSTDGGLTTTQPSVASQQVQSVGIANGWGKMYFKPDYVIIERN